MTILCVNYIVFATAKIVIRKQFTKHKLIKIGYLEVFLFSENQDFYKPCENNQGEEKED